MVHLIRSVQGTTALRHTLGESHERLAVAEEYKCEREGMHFVAVDSRGTTKQCASCGVSTEKPLWVREYSCLSCGFVQRCEPGAEHPCLRTSEVGVVHSDSTPVEAAFPTGTDSVSAKRVVDTGSPVLKE